MKDEMAWSKDTRREIERLEDWIFIILRVMGYLEGLADDGDKTAVRRYERLNTVYEDCKRIRATQYKQGLLFDGDDQDPVG